MSATYTPAMGDRIHALLTTWKLTAAAAELVPRLAAAGHDEALFTLMAERYERRSLIITSNLVSASGVASS